MKAPGIVAKIVALAVLFAASIGLAPGPRLQRGLQPVGERPAPGVEGVVRHAGPALAPNLLPSAGSQSVLFVDDDAALGGDGLSWGTALRYLQDALTAASASGGTVSEIRVARGTYKPDQDEAGNVTPGNRSATFQLLDNVAVRGGYRGLAGGGDPDDRDFAAFETILSGDLAGGDDPAEFPYGSCFGENSYNVVTGSGTDGTAVLDGVTLTGGNANVDLFEYPGDPYNSRGGGMYTDAGSPTLVDCTFSENHAWLGGGMFNRSGSHPTLTRCCFSKNWSSAAGGGIYNLEGSCPSLTHCTFTANVQSIPSSIPTSVLGSGGGMRNIDNSSPSLIDCVFTDNLADFGGGMSNYLDSNPEVLRCQFIGNTAIGAWGFFGGGMFNRRRCSPRVLECLFLRNSAQSEYRGGGMVNYEDCSPEVVDCTFGDSLGIGMVNEENSNPTVSRCTFRDSTGSGMENDVGCDPLIDNCMFLNNARCGMINYHASPIISNCSFIENIAPHNYSYEMGGGMINTGGDLTLINCIFARNSASKDSAFLAGGVCNRSMANAMLVNCTFVENTASGASYVAGAVANRLAGRVELVNCTFVGNTASSQASPAVGGILNDYYYSFTVTNSTFAGNLSTSQSTRTVGALLILNGTMGISNCILWGNTTGNGPEIGVSGQYAEAAISYCDIQGGEDGVLVEDGATLFWGVGNIDLDPGFVDLGHNDVHLQVGSPSIDAGDPGFVPEPAAKDLDGEPRVFNGRVDMGADEYNDCNANGLADYLEIADGSGRDCNGNLVLDECEPGVVPCGGLDVKPGGCPNPLNRSSQGFLPVAVVGTEHFDVAMIDVASVRLSRVDGIGGLVAPNEGPPGPHSVFEDVATPFGGGPCDCHDLAGDGLDDLSMKFSTQDVVAALEIGSLAGGDEVELVLTGTLLDGTSFTTGSDCVVIVPAGNTRARARPSQPGSAFSRGRQITRQSRP